MLVSVPECVKHQGSEVVRAGWYGSEGNRRQRWWCRPRSGAPHRFTEVLPRVVRGGSEGRHTCRECSSELDPWQGQAAPRLYGFTAREIAAALVAVAGGETYRTAAAATRDRAGRSLAVRKPPGKTPKGQTLPAANRHGQLVSDWVLVFAPVIWAHYSQRLPTRWLAVDDTPLHIRPTGGRKVRAFCVLAAVGSDPTVSNKVVAVRAVRSNTKAAWRQTLAGLPAPEVVVADRGQPRLAAQELWPRAVIRSCEWHLRNSLTQALPAAVADDPDDQLHELIRRCLWSKADLDALQAHVAVRRATKPAFANLATTTATVARLAGPQLAAKAAGAAGPHATGGVEEFLKQVRRSIGDRAHGMTNKARADALLSLLAAHHNGWADELTWADIIRDHLNAHHGLATHQRRKTDPASKPTLR